MYDKKFLHTYMRNQGWVYIMYDTDIQVVEIMDEIKHRISNECNPDSSIPNEELNEEYAQIIKKINCIHDYINFLQEDLKPNLIIGQKIPEFSRYPLLLKKILQLTAKLFARCTRFITYEQTKVNQDLIDIIQGLLESEKNILSVVTSIKFDENI